VGAAGIIIGIAKSQRAIADLCKRAAQARVIDDAGKASTQVVATNHEPITFDVYKAISLDRAHRQLGYFAVRQGQGALAKKFDTRVAARGRLVKECYSTFATRGLTVTDVGLFAW